jgi:hypothetical protein
MADKEILDIAERAATKLRNAIIIKIGSNIPPPNAPSTLEAKKPKNKTLFDSGHLLGSIETKVMLHTDDQINIEVGVFDPETAVYALANEYGADIPRRHDNRTMESGVAEGNVNEGTFHLPERSFLRSSYDENVDRIMAEMQDEILDYLEKELNKI